jgi:hypothetical protein
MMASAATNLFDAESFIGMTLGGVTDKAENPQLFLRVFACSSHCSDVVERYYLIHPQRLRIDELLIQIPPKAFPFTIPALNIRISSIAIDAASTYGIFLKVEDFGIRHPIQNLPHCPDSPTFRADQ